MRHEYFLEEAISLATRSREKANHPFGAVLVYDDKIILRAENTVITDHDATQHAELRLVSQANRKFSKSVLRSSTLYTSTEPCAMCAGAIYWSGVRKVIFGVSAKRLGELATGSFVVDSIDVFRRGRENVEVIGPLNEEESEKVHHGFW